LALPFDKKKRPSHAPIRNIAFVVSKLGHQTGDPYEPAKKAPAKGAFLACVGLVS